MGTSIILYNLRYYTEDHPHAYGDKSKKVAFVYNFIGSSPRVWGQVLSTVCKLVELRIIPTRMGTSLERNTSCRVKGDHPHAYGDKLLGVWLRQQGQGSSPRVWGQVVQVSPDGAKFGIIPTRMGTRLPQYRRWRQ